MRPFKILREKCSLHDSLTVLKFAGSLDAERVPAIGDQISLSMEQNQMFLLAEMSEVTFISSPALGELMGCKKRLVEKGGNLYIVGLSTENRNKLRLMGAGKIFEFLPTVGSAVRKYIWENENNGDEIRLRVPPILSVVPELRTLFSSIVTMRGFSKRDSFRVEAIVDELCNNAIEYGCHSGERPLEIGCRVFQYHVELSVTNARLAAQREPAAIEGIRSRILGNAPFTLNEKRGRGVELVRMLSNEFQVEFPEDRTIVRVIKKKEV